MNISNIEKAAKLMGWDDCDVQLIAGHCFVSAEDDTVKDFNPITNKADLVDLENALPSICIIMNLKMCIVTVDKDDGTGGEWEADEYFKDHPDKFTARAHAVMAVVEQIYDRTNP